MSEESRQELLYGQARTLWHRAFQGVPVAAPAPTFTLYRSDGITTLATLAVTRDTTSTTVDAASGPSIVAYKRRLYVTATGGFEIGRRYLLQSTGLPDEWVAVERIALNDYLELKTPLRWDYPIGATLKSTYLSVPVLSTTLTESNVENLCVGKWSYTVGTTAYVDGDRGELRYDVVRRNTIDPPLTYMDLIDLNGRMLRSMEPTTGGGGPQIEDAIRKQWAILRQKILNRGWDLQRVQSLDIFDVPLSIMVEKDLAAHGFIAMRGVELSDFLLQLERDFQAAMPDHVDYLVTDDETVEEEQAPAYELMYRV